MGLGSKFKRAAKRFEGSVKRAGAGAERSLRGSAQATQGAIDVLQGGNSDRFDTGLKKAGQGAYDVSVEFLDPLNLAPELRRGYGDDPSSKVDPLSTISRDFIGESFQEASATGLTTQVGDKAGLEGLKIKRKSQSGKIKQIGTAGKGGGGS